MASGGGPDVPLDIRGRGEVMVGGIHGGGDRSDLMKACLGLDRPPAAWELYVASQRRTMRKPEPSRISRKQPFSRRDLLRANYLRLWWDEK